MTNVLVEGGAEVLGSFLDAGMMDEAHVFIAPRIIGGTQAKRPVGGNGVDTLATALSLSNWEFDSVGSDVYVHGWRDGPVIG
jgi:diaminohydroxyphosphoribosylaminopyrimidine deaminase/5-amino-6-(5-phosphoribosylamino)uracil reductase